MKGARGAILACALLALAVRLYGIGGAVLTQWDEGPYVGFGLGYGPCLREDPLIVYAPPLVPLLNRVLFLVAAPDPRWAIALQAVFGALAVIAIGALATRLFSPRAGALAALMLALEPLAVQHARMALTESTFTALLLAALAAAVDAIDRPDGRRGFVAGGLAGLAFATKFHGVLPLALLPLALLRPTSRRGALAMLLAAAAGFLPALALVLAFVHQSIGFAAFAASRATWVTGLHPWTVAATLRFGFDAVRFFSSPALLVLAAAGALLALRTRRGALALIPPALLLVVLCSYRNYTRLLVPEIALLLPLAAHACDAIGARLDSKRPAIAALLVALLGLAFGTGALRDALAPAHAGYAAAAVELEARLEREDGAAVAIAQQALFPYLGPEATARTFSITERTGRDAIARRTCRFVVLDEDPSRRAGLPWSALAARVASVATIPNPLPCPVLFDRLGPERYRRYVADPSAAEFADETTIRILRVR